MDYAGSKPFIDPAGTVTLDTFSHDDDPLKKAPGVVISGANSTDVPARAVIADPDLTDPGLPTRQIPRAAASQSNSTSSAAQAFAVVTIAGGCSISVQISGTFTGKIDFDVSNDGTNWYPTPLTRSLDGVVTPYTSVPGMFKGNVPAHYQFRCYTRALSSGTVTAAIRVGNQTHVEPIRTPLTPVEPIDTTYEPDHISVAQSAAGTTTVAAAAQGCEIYVAGVMGTMSDLGTLKFTDGTDDLTGPMDINQLNGILGNPVARGNELIKAGLSRPLNIVTTAGKFNGVVDVRKVPYDGVRDIMPKAIRGKGYYCARNFRFGTDTGVGDYGRIGSTTVLARHFYPQYVYNGGTLDHLNDEIERYQTFNTTTHQFTSNSIKLHAEAMDSAGTGLVKSGMLRTKWTGKYGYFECKMKVPKGSGIWPAFWMNPQDSYWPPEVDWVEIVDNTGDGGTDWTGRSFHGIIHSYLDGVTADREPSTVNNLNQFFAYEPGFDYHDDFHTFGGLWTPREVIHYVDDIMVNRTPHLWRHFNGVDGGTCHLIVNLALGGGWAGTPVGGTLPCDLEIQHIRIWQQSNVEATNTGI